MPRQPTSWRPILTLLSLLPRAFFPKGLPIKTLYAPLMSTLSATSPTNVILLDLITRIRFGEEYRSLSFSFQFLVTSSLFCPRQFPQHRIIESSQPMFLPQCERPSFTPIQNRNNYNSMYINTPIPVAALFNAWVYGRSPTEIVSSNTARGHGCLSVVSVVCCQVEVSATGWSLVQRSPTDCGASLCVI